MEYQYSGGTFTSENRWNRLSAVQELGISETAVMSQKAVTEMNLNEFILKSARINNGTSVDETVYDNTLIQTDGTLFTGGITYSHWKTHEIHSPLTNYYVYYVEFQANSQTTNGYVTVGIYRESDDTVVALFNPHGRTVVAFRNFFYIKITTLNNHTVIGGTSIIQDTDALDTVEEKLQDLNTALKSYSIVTGTLEEKDGFYRYTDGSFAESQGFKAISFDVDENKDYYLSSVVSGSATALAVYVDSDGEYLGYQGQGANGRTDNYVNQKLILPKGTTKVLCTTLATNYNNVIRNFCLKVETTDTLENFNNTLMNLDDYQWVRTGIDLDGTISDVEDYEVGALAPNGNVDVNHTSYRTYTITNENNRNWFLFIRANLVGTLPAKAYCNVAILSEADNSVVFHARLHGTQIIAIQKGYYAKIAQSSNYGVQTSFYYKDKNTSDLSALDRYWKGKKGAWFGTSIPAQGYPINCGNYLEMTMYNEAQGSSMCRAGRKAHTPDDPLGDVYGVTGVAWQNICYSLSLNQAEKHDIFINWTTERRKANLKEQGYEDSQLTNVVGYANLMSGSFYGEEGDETVTYPSSKPIDIMTDNYITFRKYCYACCWDNSTDIESGFGEIKGKVQKYLDWDNTVDLWVLDHGHNDNLTSDTDDDFTKVPDDPYDRWTFLGAMNFIIKQIYDFNPRARIVIIGHYESTTSDYKRICDGQEVLAAYWNIPIYKCWENFQMAKARVITTNAYWDTSGNWHNSGFNGTNGNTDWRNDVSVPENPRQENGVWVHDMTMLRVWMKDALHPGSNYAKDYIGRLIALFIKNNI